jgi:hypothetical protein
MLQLRSLDHAILDYVLVAFFVLIRYPTNGQIELGMNF